MRASINGRSIAGLALLAAVLTGAAAAGIGSSPAYLVGAIAYVIVATVALLVPGALVVQVLGGLALVGSLMPGRDWTFALRLAPLLAAVVATAELLALAARMDAPFARQPGPDLRRAAVAAGTAGAVYAAIVMAGALPGPSGIIAIVAGSAACALLALRLAAER